MSTPLPEWPHLRFHRRKIVANQHAESASRDSNPRPHAAANPARNHAIELPRIRLIPQAGWSPLVGIQMPAHPAGGSSTVPFHITLHTRRSERIGLPGAENRHQSGAQRVRALNLVLLGPVRRAPRPSQAPFSVILGIWLVRRRPANARPISRVPLQRPFRGRLAGVRLASSAPRCGTATRSRDRSPDGAQVPTAGRGAEGRPGGSGAGCAARCPCPRRSAAVWVARSSFWQPARRANGAACRPAGHGSKAAPRARGPIFGGRHPRNGTIPAASVHV